MRIRDFYREAAGFYATRAIKVKPGQNRQTVLGQLVDARARANLRAWAKVHGLSEAEGLFINRRLSDPLGSKKYRIPDVRYDPGKMIWDGTIGQKMYLDSQVLDFSRYSFGHDVEIVKP